jgi:hypothetical protein
MPHVRTVFGGVDIIKPTDKLTELVMYFVVRNRNELILCIDWARLSRLVTAPHVSARESVGQIICDWLQQHPQ